MIFFLIEGNFPADELTRKKIQAIAKSVKVIGKNSVTATVESDALSLVFDPRRHSFATI